MTPFELVASKLGPLRNRMAQCPAHDDGTASLSVSEADDSKVLLNCHAGCDTDQIVGAIGLRIEDLFPPKPSTNGDRRIVATYPYTDEQGELLYQVVRFEPKDFRQRRPDGRGGWVWKLGDTRRVLYRLPRVVEAVADGNRVFVVEGEKDVEALERAGHVATCNPQGAGKWSKVSDAAQVLTGADVMIVADDDPAGWKHAREVAVSLHGVAEHVTVCKPAIGSDVAEHLGAGRGVDDLVVVASTNPNNGVPLDGWLAAGDGDDADHDDAPAPDTSSEKKSAATRLVEIAEDLYDFGISTDGDTFAVPKSGSKVVSMLRGGRSSLRARLAREYLTRTGKAANQQALADALLVIEGIAQDTDAVPLHLRVACDDADLWLDLGDETGRAVRISKHGWSVENQPPMLFRRTGLTAPLPVPEPGGDLAELWDRTNISDADRPLVAAWLVAGLYPDIPHPVLDLEGEQGSGKTTTQRTVVSMIDPSPVASRKPPRDADSWVTAAAGSWVVGLDNLSVVPDWLSDSLCRAVTGDGDVRRRLYTDGELAVFAFRRCICITGIDLGALNGDLAERLLQIRLETIDGTRRREESEWANWDQVHPRLLGALLDLATSVTSVAASVRLETRPRMADFARVLAAVDQVLGTKGLERYVAAQGSMASEALTADPFIVAVADAITTTTFEGTSAELLERIVTPDRPPKGWPANSRQVTQRLRKQAPTMRQSGWIIDDDGGANIRNAIRWTITPATEKGCNGHSSSSSDSSPQADAPTDPRASHEHDEEPTLVPSSDTRDDSPPVPREYELHEHDEGQLRTISVGDDTCPECGGPTSSLTPGRCLDLDCGHDPGQSELF